MALTEELDIHLAMTELPVRKRPGRPKEQSNPLAPLVSRTDKSFDFERLLITFTKYPAKPFGWKLIKQFEYYDDAKSKMISAFMQGTVTHWYKEDGVFKWTVRFSDGEDLDLECEELARCVHDAYGQGLKIC